MALELPVLAPPRLFADNSSLIESDVNGAANTLALSVPAKSSATDDEVSQKLLQLLESRGDVLEKWISEKADVATVERIQSKARERLKTAIVTVVDDGVLDDDEGDVVYEIAPPRSRRSSNSCQQYNNNQQNDGQPGNQSDGQLLLRPSAPPSRYDIYRSSFRGRNSLTSTLFRNWVTNPSGGKGCGKAHHGKLRERLESMNEDEMFMELLKDIANELDIDVLCHKIMVNVGFLTKADRGSLFLAKGPLENRYLVTKLFDVTVDSELEDVLWPTQGPETRIIPFGVGIAGHVAKMKESLNLKNAYQDPRFNPSIDQVTGYRTESLLCMPMCNYEGHVTGVAQIINKSNGETEFSSRDEMLFRKYLTFCGIGIQNAQLFEMSVREFKRNQFLLNLAQQIFEEQNHLERLITKILREAGEMTSARQCCLYLLEGCMTVSPDDLIEDRNRASIEENHPMFTKPEEVKFDTIYGLSTDRNEPEDLGTPCGLDSSNKIPTGQSNKSKTSGAPSSSADNRAVDEDCDDDEDLYWLSGLRILNPATDFRDPRLCQLAKIAAITGEVSSEVLAHIDQTTSTARGSSHSTALDPNRSNHPEQCRRQHKNSVAFSSTAGTASTSSTAPNIPIVIEPNGSDHPEEMASQDDKGYTYPLQVLSVPVREGILRRVVGVVQLIQKENVGECPFSDSDAAMVEAVAIFCGLGVRNTKMYEGAMKLMAKQKVALECLSYHAAAAPEDTHKLVEASSSLVPVAPTIPMAHHNVQQVEPILYKFDFNDFEMSDLDTCLSVVKMFHALNLNSRFMIPHEVMCQWIMSVKKNYRPIKYHNWRHAINVAQTMFAVLTTGKLGQFMCDEEIFALLIACLSHDLDHRGTNNAFQAKSASPLAVLYTTSPMEHHHFDQCIMILNTAGSNILQAVSPEVYKKIIKYIESAILATDLATYFRKKQLFLDLLEKGDTWDWQEEEKKELLCGMLMTACDVAAIAKPWEVQQKIARLVADEFFEQGDIERLQLNQEPIAMMDREKKDELPMMQVNFIDNICLPLYKSLSETFPWLKPLYDGCCENRAIWKRMAEQVEMGLTWINSTSIHDAMSNVGGKIEPEKVYLVPRHSIRSTRSSQASLSVGSIDLERRRSSGMSSSDRCSSRSRKSSDLDYTPIPPAPTPTPFATSSSGYGGFCSYQGSSNNNNPTNKQQCPILRVEHVDYLDENEGELSVKGGSLPATPKKSNRLKEGGIQGSDDGSPHRHSKKSTSSPIKAKLFAAKSRLQGDLRQSMKQKKSDAAREKNRQLSETGLTEPVDHDGGQKEEETRKKSTSSNGSARMAAAAAVNDEKKPGAKMKVSRKKDKACLIS